MNELGYSTVAEKMAEQQLVSFVASVVGHNYRFCPDIAEGLSEVVLGAYFAHYYFVVAVF